jgi:hypothetical protein
MLLWVNLWVPLIGRLPKRIGDRAREGWLLASPESLRLRAPLYFHLRRWGLLSRHSGRSSLTTRDGLRRGLGLGLARGRVTARWCDGTRSECWDGTVMACRCLSRG